MGRLEGLRLLQRIKTSGDTSNRFRLHEFIRQSVAGRLRTYNPHNWREIHRRASSYYFQKLQRWEDSPYQPYGAWYRFEESKWREYKLEWLHHSGMLTEDRPTTRAQFTLVFLEAFWWWGCYIPFPFNRRLLEDWNRAAAEWERANATDEARTLRADDQLLHEALTVLLNEYPMGHLKPREANWDLIRDKLLLIRRLCGLHPSIPKKGTPRENAELRRANAFITLFLAHTRRFADPTDTKANHYYAMTAAAFAELQDEWNMAWIAFERADLALERPDLADAAEHLGSAALRARNLVVKDSEWDHELAGNIHRTLADLLWSRGEWAGAAREYGRAVAHAYWFQGDPHAPDEYTQQYYLELTSRSAARVLALREEGRSPDNADARRFVATLVAETPNARQQAAAQQPDDPANRTASDVRDKLFLPGPKEDELRTEHSAFLNTWQLLCEDSSPMLQWLVDVEDVASGLRETRPTQS